MSTSYQDIERVYDELIADITEREQGLDHEALDGNLFPNE